MKGRHECYEVLKRAATELGSATFGAAQGIDPAKIMERIRNAKEAIAVAEDMLIARSGTSRNPPQSRRPFPSQSDG